jgi:hypothetical protein
MVPDFREEHERVRERFGCGRAGEPVPEVDPSDVKAVWASGQHVKKAHPEGNVAIGVGTFQSPLHARSKHHRNRVPGGDDWNASAYYARISKSFGPGQVGRNVSDSRNDLMEWMGVGNVRRGFPFDADDFIRRVREAAQVLSCPE